MDYILTIFIFFPKSIHLSITNFVPRDLPSQKAMTRSALLIMSILRLSGAPFPYIS